MKRSLSGVLGEFAATLRTADLPPQVLERARLTVLHNLGVALAGWGPPLPPLDLARRAPEVQDGARLLVEGRPVDVLEAAFGNACLMHIRTQDDFFSGANAHLGAVILPAVLALAESTGASGDEVLAAIVAGYEVMAAVGEGFSERTTPPGFRPTGIFGPFGAAAAAGRLLKLGPNRVGQAIAISASLAGGLTQAWLEGTLEWDLQVGMACRNGILSGLLAREGMSGAEAALEGPRGFYHAFAGEEAVAREVADLRLGERWRILENTFKRFPVSGISQVPVRTALKVRTENRLAPESIQEVELAVNEFERRYPAVDNPGPFGGPGAALMSLQYCVATAFQEGHVVWRDLRESSNPARLDLARRIRLRGEPDRPPLSCRIRVMTREGQTLEGESKAAEGLHFDRSEAIALIRSLLPEIPLGREKIEGLFQEALQIERAVSVKKLIDCCVRD